MREIIRSGTNRNSYASFNPVFGHFNFSNVTATATRANLILGHVPLILVRHSRQSHNGPNLAASSSSTSQIPTPQNSSQVGARLNNWKRFARVVKYSRIPLLVVSVFGLGYNQGIIDYSRDPEAKKKQLLSQALTGVAATSANLIVDGSDIRLRQVQRVGSRMTGTARQFVQRELRLAVQKWEENTKTFGGGIAVIDPQVEFWHAAERNMEGKWNYYLIESPIPNAFVSEVLPHNIFITTSMMDNFIQHDDDMALIFGHELSHLILGHVSQANQLELMLRALELLFLSMDPSEGFISLAFMSLLGASRSLIGATHSKNSERQADELGIKLAAMGCYDTKLASNVFERMHQFDTESAAGKVKEQHRVLRWFDTHPPTAERGQFLFQESNVENKEKYFNECSDVKDKLMKVFRLAK